MSTKLFLKILSTSWIVVIMALIALTLLHQDVKDYMPLQVILLFIVVSEGCLVLAIRLIWDV